MSETKAFHHPVQIYADDWNANDRHRLIILPTYCGDHLLEIRINLNRIRYYTDDYQWHELLAKGEKAIHTSASLEVDRTDFNKGMINLRVNSAVTGFKEEQVVDWLIWLVVEFLPTIEKR